MLFLQYLFVVPVNVFPVKMTTTIIIISIIIIIRAITANIVLSYHVFHVLPDELFKASF